MEGLRKRGHEVRVVGGYGRTMFGRGQVIKVCTFIFGVVSLVLFIGGGGGHLLTGWVGGL